MQGLGDVGVYKEAGEGGYLLSNRKIINRLLG